MAKIERHADGTITIAVLRGDDNYDVSDGQLYAVETVDAETWKELTSKASMDEAAKAEEAEEKAAEKAAKKLESDKPGEEPEEEAG